MKRIFVLFFVIVFFCSAFVHAQGTQYNKTDILHPVFSEKVMISLVPVPIIFNGFRVDADIRLGDNLWLNIAPRFNLKVAADTASEFVYGGGLDINARYYVRNTPDGFYISAGLGAEYNRLADIIKKPKPAQYLEVTSLRFGGQAHLGYSIRLWPDCSMDFYVGATFRYSSNSFVDDKSQEVYDKIKINPFSYYFSGICFDGGIRISITL
ncbi:MAG: hypothetical protein LBR45_03255 [Bacteroidales bacterium]|jgi:hypothetical protein|nr:hypothetical protein [Bacteroidales bacterium]